MKKGKTMITYDQALERAKTVKEGIDGCTEYEKGYMFGCSKDEEFVGGYGHTPVVVRKEDGKIMTMPEFVMNGPGEYIRSFDI